MRIPSAINMVDTQKLYLCYAATGALWSPVAVMCQHFCTELQSFACADFFVVVRFFVITPFFIFMMTIFAPVCSSVVHFGVARKLQNGFCLLASRTLFHTLHLRGIVYFLPSFLSRLVETIMTKVVNAILTSFIGNEFFFWKFSSTTSTRYQCHSSSRILFVPTL